MNWQSFDQVQVQLFLRKRYQEAEARLLQVHRDARESGDRELTAESSLRLAQLYCLPMAENLQQAAYYFDETETHAPTDYNRLQTALFRFYCLRDPAATLDKLNKITEADTGTLFSATALKGECLLWLDTIDDIPAILAKLLELASTSRDKITEGDAINLLRQLASRMLFPQQCQQLVDELLDSPLSDETTEALQAVRNTIGSS